MNCLFSYEELFLNHLAKGWSQVFACSCVHNLERHRWISILECLFVFHFFSLAIPEPFVQLLLCEARELDEVFEKLLVPAAFVEVVVVH